MKKIIFMVATVIAFASCSQTELDENFVGQKEIKFSNLNDKVNSRAANDADDNYVVYAAWSGGSTNWFIDGDVVNGTTNIPTGIYHWPATGTVDFYAWAPATVTTTASYSDLTINYTVPAAANQDFTIAAPALGQKSTTNSGKVSLEFAHTLPKVSVTALLNQDLLDAGYTLDTDGLVADLGVALNAGTIDPKAATPAWSAPSGAAAKYSDAASYMIMPQSSIDCTVRIRGGIKITKNGAEIYNGDLSTYTIKSTDVTDDQFAMGKHYMLVLTISDKSTGGGGTDPENPNPIFNIIQFESKVADWDTPAGTDTPLVQP